MRKWIGQGTPGFAAIVGFLFGLTMFLIFGNVFIGMAEQFRLGVVLIAAFYIAPFALAWFLARSVMIKNAKLRKEAQEKEEID